MQQSSLARFSIILIFISFILNINAQGSEQIVINDTVRITPYAVENIANETESTFALIRELESLIKSSDQFIGNDTLFYGTINKVKAIRKQSKTDSLTNLSYRTLSLIESQVRSSKVELDKYKSTLNSTSGTLESKINQTDQVRQKWELTQRAAIKEGRPQKLIQQIKENINNLREKEKTLRNLQNQTLNLQSDVTDQVVFLDEFNTNIHQILEELKGDIFSLDYPPLWKTLQVLGDSTKLKTEIESSFTKKKDEIVGNLNKNLSGLYKFAFLFVLIFFSLTYVKNKVLKQGFTEYNQYVSSSLTLLKNPYSLSVILSLFFLEVFIPARYTSIYLCFRVFYAVPLFSLIPKISKRTPSNLYIIYIVYALFEILEIFFIDITLIHQVELLLQALIGCALAYQIHIQLRKFKIETDKTLYLFLIFLLRLSYVGFILAFILAFIGNSNLSNLLTDGFFKMIFGGIFVYATLYIIINLSGFGVKYGKAINSNILKEYPGLIMKKLTKNLRLVGFIYWLYFTLRNFLIFDPIYQWFANVLSEKLMLGNISLSLGSLTAFLLTLYISFTLTRFIRFILDDEVFTHFTMPRGIPGAISMIVRLLLIGLGFTLAFAAANIDISNITIIFGALGVGIGFGLQNIFNNLVSGLILAFERPIQVGDTIELDNLKVMGQVKEIGIRASTIRTFDGAEVIVPNGNLISNEMVNWTLSDNTRRQEMLVGVAYGSDLTTVLRVLEETIANESSILNQPEPRVLFHGFGDSSIDFRLLYWTHFDNGLVSKSALGFSINKAFEIEGISIPFPQRDIHIITPPNIEEKNKGLEKETER